MNLKNKLSSLGEFAFIDLIKKSNIHFKSSIIRSIGDDAAVLKWSPNKQMVVTTDMLVEHKHFKRSEATAYEIGKKAMAVNISDIAAMGALPKYALVSVGLPSDTQTAYALELQRGLKENAEKFNASIVGGDTNSAPFLIINVVLIGEVESGKAVYRNGAKAGDVIFVTGPLGGSYSSKRHIHFTPRVELARYLSQHYKIHSMMDLSDGLSSDIDKICTESKKGCVLDWAAIPLHSDVKDTQAALNDGEDFELLLTVSVKEAAKMAYDTSKFKNCFYPVGKITANISDRLIVMPGLKAKSFKISGFNHFGHYAD